jgi:quercetin dioxygenase-like cupin family protein
MSYEVAHINDVEEQSMEAIDKFPTKYRILTQALDLEEMRANVWHFEPGEDLVYHAHDEQEELVYILHGQFELTIGYPNETETHEIEAGTAYAASPDVGRGLKNIGDTEGTILALGAPSVDDMVKEPEPRKEN